MVRNTIFHPKLIVFVTFLLVGANSKPAKRVVGGEDGDVGEFPYQVSLRAKQRHVCGGTIIGKRHILTAAHCIRGVSMNPDREITVITGTNSVAPGAGVIHAIKTVTMHPQYSSDFYQSWKNDLAVIALTRDIVFDTVTKAIPLSDKVTVANVTGIASGWGDISYPISQKPNNVRKAEMTTITNDECQERYYDVTILDTHLCVVASPGVGLCSGDSGGPLIYEGALVGVAAFVMPCAKGAPDVFTRIYPYLGFIKTAIADT